MSTETVSQLIACDMQPNERAVVVSIAVLVTGSGYELRVFPQRSGDTLIFHSEPRTAESPEKPRQVRWVATGLEAGQTLKIAAKKRGTEQLPQDEFKITHPCNSVRSGEATRHPGEAGELQWPYYVILLDDQQVELARTPDPTVIIKNDP
jgi:hypothetical protein